MPALVCGWVNFPILWPHTPVQMKLKCPPPPGFSNLSNDVNECRYGFLFEEGGSNDVNDSSRRLILIGQTGFELQMLGFCQTALAVEMLTKMNADVSYI